VTHAPPRELVSSQRPGERAPLVRVVGRCLSSLQLENDDGEEGNLLVKQPLQWASEKRRAYRVSVDLVEVERVSGNACLTGACFVVPFMRERVVHRRTSCNNGKG